MLFLSAFAHILGPPRVAEIGTSTGFSAALLAAATPRVDTIDLHTHYMFDRSQSIGFQVAQVVPDLAARVHIHTERDATFLSELAAPRELPLVFIDADHQHPRPLLDLLRVAPFVSPRGWVILHDIQLGTCGAQAAETKWGAVYGAQWLFEQWPFRKITGGNIGAVQLPADLRRLIAPALHLLRIPFELTPSSHRKTWRALAEAVDHLSR